MGSLVRAHSISEGGIKIPLKQQISDISTLMGHARMAQSKLVSFSEALATELGLDPYTAVQSAPLKTLTRAWEKAIKKYDGDMSAITDFCRDRILFNDPDQIKYLRSIFGPGINSNNFSCLWQNRGIEVVEFEDYFMDPKDHGYIGLNMTIKVDLGKGRYHIVEIQFMHEKMLQTDKDSHFLYEQMREYIDAAVGEKRELTKDEKKVIQSLQEANKTLYEEAAERLGLNELKRKKYVHPSAAIVPFKQKVA